MICSRYCHGHPGINKGSLLSSLLQISNDPKRLTMSYEAWKPLEYDLSKTPLLARTLDINADTVLKDNFPRTGKWCSDGSAALVQCENRIFQLFDATNLADNIESVVPPKVFAQAAPILEFLWYPAATVLDPTSFCFLASVRECPVKLLDASDGRLRASYRIVDHRERQIAPHSLTFDLTAQKLYCGFEDAIEIFDISRPGEGTRIMTTPSKKSRDGLKGIISALAFSPSYSPDENFYAAGSFAPSSCNIAMFSDASSEPVMFLSGGPRAGVTQLQFNPIKPHILYAAYRGSGSGTIYSWDIRSNLDVPLEIFSTGSNPRTNQKMRFDVDLAGRYLSVGDQLGSISVFSLDSNLNDMDHHSDISNIHTPDLQFNGHSDAIGSVSFHPLKPFLLSVSGSRHFTEKDIGESSENDEEDHTIFRKKRLHPITFDSTIKVWDFTLS